jgi:hypothetical protein
MDVGANGSFTFTAFVNTGKSTAAFVDYNVPPPLGLHIWSYPSYDLFVNMPKRSPHQSSGVTFNLKLTANRWHFIGVSYDMAKKQLIGMVDKKTEAKSFGGWTVYTKTTQTWIGRRLTESNSYLRGKMSCAMLFSVGLSIDEMQRARKHCMKFAKQQGKWVCLSSDCAGPPGTTWQRGCFSRRPGRENFFPRILGTQCTYINQSEMGDNMT